ncbi:Pimeloyl-ACP methyl ester carboxylesterase [Paenibacillus sp. yr247]|uniref:alpha/beta fold hydrolase n=1 Tax=Paenibacillus sp. yr247 TaxID=1761880 RepID=UPI000888C213|nr:alpha/beta hydrolase [Paenibacillus sp. yr247]SDO75494.1 Pimeloyl-ACP methyl ester carboxylesterase [Paenibacillus sp. yr247]
MDSFISLPDGRKIGFAQYGNPVGFPLFFFHGTPSSRINSTVKTLHTLISHPNTPQFRVIALERPGYGISDPQPDRTLNDWVQDTLITADLLGIEKFAIMGVSGGGPYAIAVSHGAPERVTRTAILSGIGPLDVPELRSSVSAAEDMMLKAAEHAPEKLVAWINRVKDDPAAFVNQIYSLLSEEQKNQLPRDILEIYIESLREGCRQPDGLISDYLIFGRSWNMEFSRIRIPIRFWHSDSDEDVAIRNAEYLSSVIPGAELIRLNGLNHYASAITPLREVILYMSEGTN